MRADHDLAFLMQYENIAWFDGEIVKILDRRVYPSEIRYEICKTHVEVMQAIRDMVTQSAGPYSAAPMGMALAAHECEGQAPEQRLEYLKMAAECISNARPTTKKRLEISCAESLRAAEEAVLNGKDITSAVFENTV